MQIHNIFCPSTAKDTKRFPSFSFFIGCQNLLCFDPTSECTVKHNFNILSGFQKHFSTLLQCCENHFEGVRFSDLISLVQPIFSEIRLLLISATVVGRKFMTHWWRNFFRVSMMPSNNNQAKTLVLMIAGVENSENVSSFIAKWRRGEGIQSFFDVQSPRGKL